MILNLFKDAESFESLQIVAGAGENCTNLGADGSENDKEQRLEVRSSYINTYI